MRLIDIIDLCIRNLTRRKVRTLLTVVGVVVGTCAIVVMISIGIGMNKSQEELLSQMGDLKMINVYNYNSQSDAKITDDIVAQWQALEGVDFITPMYEDYSLSLMLYSGSSNRYEMYCNIVGVYPEALEKFGYELSEGEYLSESGSSKTINLVFGEKAAYQFRDTKRSGEKAYINYWNVMEGEELPPPFVEIMEDKLTLKPQLNSSGAKPIIYNVNALGVLKEDYSKDYRTSNGIFMSINDMKRIAQEIKKANGEKASTNIGYQEVYIRVTDIKYIEDIEASVKEAGFETSSMDSIRKPMQEQAKKQQLILGGLGAISLFVAAIGITNTMIMSIYERTREIGVMKALGCYVKNVRSIFLMEAGCIGFLGGVAGVVISYAISFLLNKFGSGMMSAGSDMYYYADTSTVSSTISIIPLWLVGLAILFATFIGLISGYYPANRAVKISAIEAIKTE